MFQQMFVLGRLVNDPVLHRGQAGPFVTLTVASNRIWRNPDGSLGESTEFHPAIVHGPMAPTVARRLVKGGVVFLTGYLRSSTKHSGTTVHHNRTLVVQEWQAVDRPPRAASDDGSSDRVATDEGL